MKPVFRISIAVVIAGLACWWLAMPFIRVNHQYDHHDRKRLQEIYEGSSPYNLVFLGSSRTHRSINPRVIDSLCGTNSYNAGTEAGSMEEFAMTFDGYLVHHPVPLAVVLTIDLSSFAKPSGIHAPTLYYRYCDNRGVWEHMSRYYRLSLYLQKLLPFLEIADYDDYTKESSIQKLKGRDTIDIPAGDFEYKGYLSNTESWINNPKEDTLRLPVSISAEADALLQGIIDSCRQKNIRLIFTYAPEYNFCLQHTRVPADSIFAHITRLAAVNHIPFLRDDSLALCKDPHLFANFGHLNKPGAWVYSQVLAEELKPWLKSNP